MKKIKFFSGVALLAMGSFGAVELASPFVDNMVLQRNKPVRVWGTADAGETVTVRFADQKVCSVADKNGSWKVELSPMEASKENRMMTVTASNPEKATWKNCFGLFAAKNVSNEITLKNILVGEVWFCAGQSNTEMPLVGRNPRFYDRQGFLVAQMTRNPYLRFVNASNYKWSVDPKTKPSYKVEWKEFNTENLMNGRSFSAMGVYFALELYAALDIPVGIVGTYWGGTRLEPWTPRCGYENFKGLEDVAQAKIYKPTDPEVKTQKGQKRPKVAGHQQPSVLWNEMVESWCPMTIKGFIWYQGCSNAGDGMRYSLKMQALREGWAKKFENPELKLYFVQLAPFGVSWFNVQLGQADYAARDKHAGMVTTCDIGNIYDIHPSEKGTIGKRLAALALKRDYGMTSIKAEVPTLKKAVAKDGKVYLSFNDAPGWYVYSDNRSVEVPFELAGADGKWVKAKLQNVQGNGNVSGSELVLAAEGVAKPVKVRYLFNKPWVGNLYSSWGIPLGPMLSEIK